ncbi:MAG: two-component regulator propeller domain-containing protein, partial [Verrucomicrobiota bacterium]
GVIADVASEGISDSFKPIQLSDAYLVERWGADEGLPSSHVLALAQTVDGYVWIGTRQGLVRFDGVTFQIFDSSRVPEFTSDFVHSLHADRQGRLWIALPDRWIVRVRDTFIADPELRNLPRLAEDRSGEMLVMKQGSLFRWEQSGLTPLLLPENVAPGQFMVFSDFGQKVLLRAEGGLFEREAGGWKRISTTSPPPDHGWVLFRRRAGNFLMLRGTELWEVQSDFAARLSRRLPWREMACHNLIDDREGNLWFATAGQGLCFLGREGQFGSVSKANNVLANDVSIVMEDHEGNIWAGADNGLYRLRRRAFQMIGENKGLMGPVISAVATSREGSLWIGSRARGLFEWRPDWPMVKERSSGLPVLSLCSTETGALWVGTDGYGMFRYEDGKREQVIPAGAAEQPAVFVTAMLQSRSGTTWFGGDKGLFLRQPDGAFVEMGSKASPSIQAVRGLAEDETGRVWIATDGQGLFSFANDRFQNFGAREGLRVAALWSLLCDREGTLWIGTYNAGLWSFQEGRFQPCVPHDRLPGGAICDMAFDGLGSLWLSCANGVARLPRSDLSRWSQPTDAEVVVHTFGRRDGLQTREITGRSGPKICPLNDGRLAFATADGVALLSPQALPLNTNPPPVLIEEVRVDEMVLKPEPADAANAPQFKVPPGRRRIEVRYTALSFAAPERVQFRYRLEGLADDWVSAGHRRQAFFTSLAPGPYQFRVIAANGDGVWNQTGAALSLLVMPHFWQTVWFKISALLFSALSFAAIAYATAHRRHRREIERLQREQAIERERGRIARDLHDDLGSSLTKITQLAHRGLARPGESTTHLHSITSTCQNLVSALDEIVWAVNPRNDTVDHLVTYLCRYAEDYLRTAGLRCRLDVPLELPNERLSAETRHNLYLVLKEALNNVVRHARATQCHLRFSVAATQLQIIVEDDGCGFDPAKAAGDGNGLVNMKERIRDLGGDIQWEAAPGRGLRLNLRVPLDSNPTAARSESS